MIAETPDLGRLSGVPDRRRRMRDPGEPVRATWASPASTPAWRPRPRSSSACRSSAGARACRRPASRRTARPAGGCSAASPWSCRCRPGAGARGPPRPQSHDARRAHGTGGPTSARHGPPRPWGCPRGRARGCGGGVPGGLHVVLEVGRLGDFDFAFAQCMMATMYLSRLLTDPGPSSPRSLVTVTRVVSVTSLSRNLPSKGSRWQRSRTSLLCIVLGLWRLARPCASQVAANSSTVGRRSVALRELGPLRSTSCSRRTPIWRAAVNEVAPRALRRSRWIVPPSRLSSFARPLAQQDKLVARAWAQRCGLSLHHSFHRGPRDDDRPRRRGLGRRWLTTPGNAPMNFMREQGGPPGRRQPAPPGLPRQVARRGPPRRPLRGRQLGPSRRVSA